MKNNLVSTGQYTGSFLFCSPWSQRFAKHPQKVLLLSTVLSHPPSPHFMNQHGTDWNFCGVNNGLNCRKYWLDDGTIGKGFDDIGGSIVSYFGGFLLRYWTSVSQTKPSLRDVLNTSRRSEWKSAHGLDNNSNSVNSRSHPCSCSQCSSHGYPRGQKVMYPERETLCFGTVFVLPLSGRLLYYDLLYTGEVVALQRIDIQREDSLRL